MRPCYCFPSVVNDVPFDCSSRSYYAVISVGNASYRVVLDTGSADLWLVSSACQEATCSVPKYQLGYKSPTFLSINNNQTAFNVSFADGTSKYTSGFS